MSATILSIIINYLELFIEVFRIKCDLDKYFVTNATAPILTLIYIKFNQYMVSNIVPVFNMCNFLGYWHPLTTEFHQQTALQYGC
jgi:hypothetical protein